MLLLLLWHQNCCNCFNNSCFYLGSLGITTHKNLLQCSCAQGVKEIAAAVVGFVATNVAVIASMVAVLTLAPWAVQQIIMFLLNLVMPKESKQIQLPMHQH